MTERCFFAGRADGDCSALVDKICETRKCPFFKTEKEYRDGLAKFPVTDIKYLAAARGKRYIVREKQ